MNKGRGEGKEEKEEEKGVTRRTKREVSKVNGKKKKEGAKV